MSHRTYEDACGAARALDVMGERWALLVVRELVFGPKRFRDLRTGLPTASQNVLSQRLRELESAGIVERVELGPPASTHAYQLTALGGQLEPALMELARFGAFFPAGPGTSMSTDAMMLLLKASYTPGKDAPALSSRLIVGTDPFEVRVSSGAISVVRGASGQVDAVVTGAVQTFLDVIRSPVSFDSRVRAGAIAVTGDHASARRFFTMFGGPQRSA